ncbi:MAG TPA: hypothetical protein VLY63_09480 [Anaerolineae bacterium]|nr:hypothetical protein [Anaerolineae bacterium]
MDSLDLQQVEGLFFVLLALIAVILVALIVYVVLANWRQRAKMVEAYEADKFAPRPTRHLTGQILSLVRAGPGQPLKVAINGVQYRRMADIEDPQVRRQVVGAALELVQFTGALGSDAIAPIPLEEADSWREDMRADSKVELERIHTVAARARSQPQTPPASEEVEEQFLSLLTQMSQAHASPEKPGVIRSIQQRMAPRKGESESARTFLDDIDDILQRRIQLIPAMIGRDLHVRLDSGDAVHFAFEGREYDNLDDLPNLTAQQLIKDAIQEWEDTV